MIKPGQIFVFGSNTAGIHGAGAAREAVIKHGAVMGVGEGRTGNAYALPSKDQRLKTLPLHTVNYYVDTFCQHASDNLDTVFYVTRIGCGLAGFQDFQIAPMFNKVPSNCILPIEWKVYLPPNVTAQLTFHFWDDDQRANR